MKLIAAAEGKESKIKNCAQDKTSRPRGGEKKIMEYVYFPTGKEAEHILKKRNENHEQKHAI
jgi:hypothetical protein